MSNINITLNGEGVQHTQKLDIQVSIVATVNINARAARRQATAWLVSEVGNMLIGGPPQLLISRQCTVWRVPAVLTSSIAGHIGEVGVVEINAENGELILTDQLKGQILNNVKRLTRSTPTPIG